MSLVEYDGRISENGFSFRYNTIESHKDHAPTKATLKGRIWEKKIFDIYKNIVDKDDIVYDIGGYIGTHTLPLSKYAKTVVVFEPNTEICNCLISNIELNEVENVEVYELGLSDECATHLFSKRQDGTSRMYHKSFTKTQMAKWHNKHEIVDIETITLDSIASEQKNVKLLKIDVEGHEFQVLAGAKKVIENNRPHILVEVFKARRPQIIKWAEDNNYLLEWLKGDDFYLSPQ